MTHPLRIERERLLRFSSLLQARAALLDAQLQLEDIRRKGGWVKGYVPYVERMLYNHYDRVWAAQQACCTFELEHPLKR